MTRWSLPSFLAVLAFLLVGVSTIEVGDLTPTQIEEKRQEILAQRRQFKQRIEVMIKVVRKELADHSSGEKVLEPEKKQQAEKRIELYTQKIDSMRWEVDDDEVRKIVAREESQRKYREERGEGARRRNREHRESHTKNDHDEL